MAQLFTNNATGSLASTLSSGSTSLTLATGQGAKFPTPTGGDFFLATLVGLDTNGNENAWEIVKATGRSTDVLTIVRAQEGTSAATWGAGTRVELRTTAGTLGRTTDLVGEGTTNLYFTAARVWATVLTGLSTATNAVVTATDTVLAAIGKLQAQITGYKDAALTFTNKTLTDPVINGFTGSTASINIGSGQITKDTSGNVGIGSGNLTFGGAGQRITGDFSTATVSNRPLFQSSVTNGSTTVGIIPNGTSTISQLNLETDSTTTNSSFLQLAISSTEIKFLSSARGSGTFLPTVFYMGGTERMRIDTAGKVGIGVSSIGYQLDVRSNTASATNWVASINTSATSPSAGFFSQNSAVTGAPYSFNYVDGAGNLHFGNTGVSGAGVIDFTNTGAVRFSIDAVGNVFVATGSLGYGSGTGAGGTVTQATSKATAVTLNKPTGKIILANDTLNAGAVTFFQFNNSVLSATDTLTLTVVGASNMTYYNVWHGNGGAGYTYIAIQNISGSNLTESFGIQYNVHKGAIS